MQNTLPAITALARAGAVERAWELYLQAGHANRTGSPAALAVKGRLLKDRARLAPAEDRAALFTAAADAYAAALALDPAPYLAINVASLRLFAGQDGASRKTASAVLAMLDGPVPLDDTPYYLEATRAEALLLLGDAAAAEAAMTRAAAAARASWEDRAVTVAQLREVARAMHQPAAWIDRFAPPASLHFAGHIGFAAEGTSEKALVAALGPLFDAHPVGFAWGALAAGADIIIAEQLLARGCTVHAVLPCPPDLFEAQSVTPAGPEWVARYRVVLGQMESVRSAGDNPASVHDPLATRFAGELAIGGAMLSARRLAAPALQLAVVDEAGGGTNTAAQVAMWRAAIGESLRVTIPRDCAVEALFPPEQPDPSRHLALHAVIGLDQGDDHAAPAAQAIASALAVLPRECVRAAPGCWEIACTDAEAALAALLDVLDRCRAGSTQPAIGAHLAIGNLVRDQASGSLIPYGNGLPQARQLQARAPAGAIMVSDAVAVTLAARGTPGLRTELYHPGDDEAGAAHLLLRSSAQ